MANTPANAKKPEDHKLGQNEPFVYNSTVGEINLPPFKINSGFLRRNRKLSDLDMMYTLLEEKADAENLALTDELEDNEVSKLFEAWQAQAGVTLGKS